MRKYIVNKPSTYNMNCSSDFEAGRDYADRIENISVPPRSFSLNVYMDNSYATNKNMEWVPYITSYDDENLVDPFIKVVTINDDSNYRRMDREEIRRRLAMGSDDYCIERFSCKPSLQERLQSGMNLQICFMNETLSDKDSPNSYTESSGALNPEQLKPNFKLSHQEKVRPTTLDIPEQRKTDTATEVAKLHTEASMALAQAKGMAEMQMGVERQRQKKSPVTELIKRSLEKIGISFPEGKRRLSRQILTEMNVAQLQVIVNDLHSQIETLNEALVGYLMKRDDLHMEQDSMLVDIEDLTRYL